jgi:glycosyltransferase involved in cell wall biosynthesis
MIYSFGNVYTTQVPVCPRVSIITSLFKGDKFIESFMREIVKQTIFDQCELIIINANSPEDEEAIILPYVERYSNIIYIKLVKDPGIYGVWNMAIKLARGEYIVNANVDDGFRYNALGKYMYVLDKNPDIDLVYSDYCLVEAFPTSFYAIKYAKIRRKRDFSLSALAFECLPNCHPMWRKSMHEKYGYFDDTYFSTGDYEMWIRAALQGSKFKRIPEILGFFYNDPKVEKNVNCYWAREIKRIYQDYEAFFVKYHPNWNATKKLLR